MGLAGCRSDSVDQRDSYTHTLLAGIEHSISSKLHGSLRAGLDFRSSTGQQFSSLDGANPHFDGSLNYQAGGKTTLSWTASYAIQESYVITSSGSQTFRTGLVASHEITPRLSSNITFYYLHNFNEGAEIFPGFSTASFVEDTFNLSLGLSYSINRYFTANAGYTHTEVASDLMLRSYSRNGVSGGLSFNF